MKPDDAELVRRCLDGEREAFETLIERYEKPIYNLALRMLADREEASDVVQTVFAKVFEKLGAYDSHHRFFSWVYRIAIHESIDVLDRRRRSAPLHDAELREHRNPETEAGTEELGRIVQRALMAMAPEYRSVIVLRHFLDCSYRDMGEILGISEKTVKSRLFTARQQLRERLSAQGVLAR